MDPCTAVGWLVQGSTCMMSGVMAGVYNFEVDEGIAFHRKVTWKDANGAAVSLSGYTASMPITSLNTNTVAVTLSHTSGLTLGGNAGTVDIDLTPTQTDLLEEKKYVYDLLLTPPGGRPKKLLTGKITVTPKRGEV